MNKRILAVLCLVAMLASFVVAPAAVSAETTSYKVGYAIKDMNPWTDPKNPDINSLVDIKLTGNGDDDVRECAGMMDDNGDGEVKIIKDVNGNIVGGDGLFITCTAVTDYLNTTVLYITMDTLQAYDNAVSEIREKVVAKLGSSVISANQIMISGSHTHSGPNLENLKDNTTYEGWDDYYDYIIDQAVAAAVDAYNDRAPATMTRGSIDATTATANLGYTNKDNYNGGKGYRMNFVRHYDITAIKLFGSTVSYVADNKRSRKTVGAYSEISAIDDYIITSSSHTMETDNTMHVLRFEFEDAEENPPIVLVNWRAHATFNSGVDKTLVSSDYINALRYNLQKEGCRAAFLQGAAGNATISSHVLSDWKDGVADADATNTYGKLLAEIAVECLENNMTDPLPAGQIKTSQQTLTGDKQEDSEGLIAAYNQAKTDGISTFPYTYTYNGESYIINSSNHYTNIGYRISNDATKNFYKREINVISLGGNVVFVTAPNELSDRYDENASVADEDNDWLELVDGDTYGTPFVIGYANGRKGYLPSTLNYIYNTDAYKTGNGSLNGEAFLGAGVYEANTSRYAMGTGEALITKFASMIDEVVVRTARCDACDNDAAEWTALTSDDAALTTLGSGHYYLAEDLPRSNSVRKTVADGDTLCLDLNGHNIDTTGRTFSVSKGGTLNIMDNEDSGTITSYTGSNNTAGGTIRVEGESGKNGTFNLYGGTLRFIKDDESEITGKKDCERGGVVDVANYAVMNMYGGSVVGGTVVASTNVSYCSGYGGAIFVAYHAELNVSGGNITSGSVPDGYGPCVYAGYLSSKISLSGTADVEQIAFDNNNGDNFVVSGAYTGTTALWFNTDNVTLADSLVVGTSEKANLTGANISCVNDGDYSVVLSGTDLKLTKATESSVAEVHDTLGTNYYNTLLDAVENYSTGYIKLLKDTKETVSISKKDVYLDLNGFDLSSVAVDSGYTLYCMDSQTDDYVAGDYGKISTVSGEGKVLGIPVESDLAVDGYLKVTEENVGVSFHRVNLKLTEINLRAVVEGECTPSVYYTSNFMGDEKVKAAVKQFGVALSVQAMPNETNIENTEICQRSKFEGSSFQAGSAGNSGNGTLLKGIMKPTNARLVNNRNANMGIFGIAYILTEDGYLFGEGAELSLKWVSVEADKLWSKLDADEQESLVTMYETYTSIVSKWDMPNTSTAAAES